MGFARIRHVSIGLRLMFRGNLIRRRPPMDPVNLTSSIQHHIAKTMLPIGRPTILPDTFAPSCRLPTRPARATTYSAFFPTLPNNYVMIRLLFISIRRGGRSPNELYRAQLPCHLHPNSLAPWPRIYSPPAFPRSPTAPRERRLPTWQQTRRTTRTRTTEKLRIGGSGKHLTLNSN